MYRALYREYRPRTFADVYGQQHITDVLTRQIASGRVAHAYLFCGPRGTGKTSCAKLLARAVNCTAPQNGEPCGVCDNCREITADAAVDVIEMDAASNNGVDNVRDIREKVQLSPVRCKYKVYIIDEVHMLTGGAFNALLKTLEEPPAHAIFILATTEPRKIPATIRSRCQRFDFKRLGSDTIAQNLRRICGAENITADDDALAAIASYADGAMRDGISMLDRLAGAADRIDLRLVSDSIGGSNTVRLLRVALPMCAFDEKAAISELLSMIGDGGDCAILAHELTEVLRDVYAAAYLGMTGGFIRYYDDIPALAAAGRGMGRDALLHAMETMLSREYEVRMSSQPDTVLMAAVLRAVTPEADGDTAARIDKLTAEVKRLAAGTVTAVPKQQPVSAAAQQVQRAQKSKPAPARPPAASDSVSWDEIVAALKAVNCPTYYATAKQMSLISAENDMLTLQCPPDMGIAGDILSDEGFSGIITKICAEKYGKEYKIAVRGPQPQDTAQFAPWDDIPIID